MTIFSMSLRYLRGHLLDTIKKQVNGVKEGDIKYVLTVPAIWNDNAKQFMREAAVEAGIDGSHLRLALEPEAASIWFQTVITDAKVDFSKTRTQYMVVDLGAAFDFGTTYSGYAFSFRDDPLKIQTNAGWNAVTEKLISLKTPTCVLLTPNKEFHSLGYEAENKYADLAEDDKHRGWLLFQNFKMVLYNNEHLSRKTTVDDINGASMPAMTIFAMSIRYLRKQLLDDLGKHGSIVKEHDIKYVLTVPAIWHDSAKHFMREAGVEAGIEGSQLILALESEAASIWCQTDVTTDVKVAKPKSGTQYMVVDLRGGTADISVHENQTDNKLRSLHKASGGPWGGNAVDQNFMKWLTKLFGPSTIKQFKEQEMEDYFNLLRNFETKKRSFTSRTEGRITFRISVRLTQIFSEVEKKKLEDKLFDLGLSDKVTLANEKLRVDASIIKEWFSVPVKALIDYLKCILAEPKMRTVEEILLVGGFSESLFVQDQIQKEIKSKRIFIPNEPELAVLKGAVCFGHTPDIVTSRIMSFTYGLSVFVPFCKNKHPASKVVINNNKKVVAGVFLTFVRSGEEITVGQGVFKPIFTPNNPYRTSLDVYRSSNSEPEYVTDNGCARLGTMIIEHPGGRTLEDKKFGVTFIFGDTELFVTAKIIKTGQEFTVHIDCLS